MTLFRKVFVANAVLLALATVALVVSPATVSSPILATELLIVAGGLIVLLVADWLVLRRAFAAFEALKHAMARVDPLRPGERVPEDLAHQDLAGIAGAFNDMVGRLERERRDSAQRASAAQEAERRRVARDLHDEVGQRLGALLLRLQVLERQAPQALQGELHELRDDLRTGLDEIRMIARRLRPEALDELGLASALADLTAEFGRGGLHVRREVDRQLPVLSADEQLTVFRVAQEALTNVARHAGTDEANLELSRCDRGVRLSVADAGRGFPSGSHPEGQGLRSMRERALMVGARLEVWSAAGAGTRVDLELEPASHR